MPQKPEAIAMHPKGLVEDLCYMGDLSDLP
jgi:hypothetical protein